MNDRVSAIKNNQDMSIDLVIGRFHNTISPEHKEILVAPGQQANAFQQARILTSLFPTGREMKVTSPVQ